MVLKLEQLEDRVLLAAPVAPIELDLLSGSDSGTSNSDDITNDGTSTVELIAEKGSTVSIYNAGYVGDATGQGDTVFSNTNDVVVIEAERGTVTAPMGTSNAVGGYQGTGFVYENIATAADPSTGGTVTYDFYITTEADYYLHAMVYYSGGSGNSFFVNIDDQWEVADGDAWPSLWDNTFNSWHLATACVQNNNATLQSWHLTTGWHTLEVHGRESPALLDRIIIDTNSGLPGGVGGTEILYETYQYTFGAGELLGSSVGTTNTITAKATNLDGTSPASNGLSFVYDNNTITPGIPTLDAVSDTGTSNLDLLTNDTTATFTGGTGSVEGNSTVWVRVGGVNTRSGTANADGSYSITVVGGDLAEGANTVDIIYIDSAGNTSTDSANLTVTLDTTAAAPGGAPDLDAGSDSGTSNADNVTNDTTATFSGGAGSVEANSTVWIRVGGVNKQSASAAGDGSYSISLAEGDLAEGANTVDIIYIDSAGNTSADSANLTVTLDTISNKPGTPDLTSNATHDTGSSQVDDITSNEACQISGTTETNATIHVYVNGTLVGNTASDGAGDWTYTFDGVDDLTEGLNTIAITQEDSHSNVVSVVSDSLIVQLDTIMATPGTPDLTSGSDSGTSNSDNNTGSANLVFEGYAEPGATMQMYVGGVLKGASTTTHASTGYWTVTLANTDFANGANNVTVLATDAAGNNTSSGIVVITYDGSGTIPNAPKLVAGSDSGSSSADGITSVDTATVYGSVGGGNAVEGGATVHVRTNKGAGWAEVGTTVADSNGNWSYQFDGVDDLAEGTNLVEVYITDIANNNSGMSADLTIVLDQTANAPASATDLSVGSDSGGDNTDNITNDTTPTFTGGAGNVEANSTVWLRIDGTPVRSTAAAGDGSYSITLIAGDLTEGSHLIDVIYVDTAGNTSSDSANLTVTLDTSTGAPANGPQLASGSDSGTSNSDRLTNDSTATLVGVAGDVEGGSTVWVRVGGVDTRSGTANADGSYSITLVDGDLVFGANILDIYYIDTAGNTSSDSTNLTVTYDNVVADPATPDLASSSDTGTDDSDNITAETRPTIQGGAGAVEGNSIVHVWLDTPSNVYTEVGTVTAAGDGSWSYTFGSATPLEEGTNNILIVVDDEAGNTSNNSGTLSVVVNFDTGAESAPNLVTASDTGTLNTDNITTDSTATIDGVCPAGGIVKIRLNGNTITQFTDDDVTDEDGVAGQWQYTFGGGVLVEGTNTIDFLTIDSSNVTSDWSLDLVVVLDTSIEKPITPNLKTADDSGTSSGDDITNVTTGTITGTAEANSTVTVNINAGAHTDTAAVGANGTWSYTITDGWLNEGANTIFVTAKDTAGNVSVASDNLTITLDTTVNVPATPDLTAATDTGSNNSDNVTSHSNPRITGTADANTTIVVRVDPNGANTVVGTTAADGAGNWSFTFPSGVLVEGANEIDVVSSDSAGNSANSAELTVTIETLISVPTNLDLVSGSDLGDANNDDITSQDAATISGDSDANSTIYVRVNGTVVGNTASNGLGAWSYTFDGVDDLVEGINIIDAYAEDDSGNVSGYATDLIVVLDTKISVPLKPGLDTASDSGGIDSDRYTNDSTATISGSCETGATVIIHLNGNDTFDTVQDSDLDGSWSYTFAGGLIGDVNGSANTIKVAQQDVAGNVSSYSSVLTVTLDDSAETPSQPDLDSNYDSGDFDNDDLTNIGNVIISGTVEVASSLQIYIDQGSGAVLVDTISERLVSSGTYTYTLSSGQLAEGDNDITIIATDKAGNVSASSPALTITLDQSINQPGLPDLASASDTGESDNDDITSDETPTFGGVCDANSHVTIRVDGQDINTVTADGVGTWSYTFGLGEIDNGVHRIDVVAVDPAGNVSSPSDDLTIWLNEIPTQPAAPNLKAESDSGSISTDNWTNIQTGIIEGKSDSNRTVEIYVDAAMVGTTTSDHDGFWEYQFLTGMLTEGHNEITIITEDSSGLRSASSYPLDILIDLTAPNAITPDLQASSDTGVSNDDNKTSDTTATIEGTTEPSALITLYLDDVELRTLTATTNGYWSYTFNPDVLVAGENDISITVTDVAGNESVMSDDLTIVLDIDQDAPDVPVLTPESDTGSSQIDGLTRNSTPDIYGTVKPDSSVEIRVSGIVVNTVQADNAGAWNYTFNSGELEEGKNTIEIVSTDPVGNVARSTSLELTVDTESPVIYNFFPRNIYTHTTNIIELYIHGDDLDTLAAADTSGYILIGSGGDGSYDDGNEWTIPIQSVTVDQVSGLVQLNAAIILTDDSYMLSIETDTSFKDEAGNPVVLDLSASTIDSINNPITGDDIGAMESSSEILTFMFAIDTAGPDAPSAPMLDESSDSGSSDSDNITTVQNPLVYVTADADLSVEIICNGRSAGFANEIEPGIYQLYIDSSLVREGENITLARAFDGLGNSSDLSEIETFTYDSRGPEVAAIVNDTVWYDHGPTEIVIVLDEEAINWNTVLDTSNYLLEASGGDCSFGDGNELVIGIQSVSYNSATQSIILTLPQSVTGTSDLGADCYRISILPDVSIEDAAGNILSVGNSSEFQVIETEIIRDNESFSFVDDSGLKVKVRLIGKGEARIITGDSVDSDQIIDRIILKDTTSNSILKMTSNSRSIPLTIGRILSETALDSIISTRAEIVDEITIEDTLRRLNINAIYDNAIINLISPSDVIDDDKPSGLTLTADSIGEHVSINIEGSLYQIKADEYKSGTLEVDDLYQLKIKEDMGADIVVDNGGLASFKVSRGDFSGDLTVAEEIGLLSVKRGRISGSIESESIRSMSVGELNQAELNVETFIDYIKAEDGVNAMISAGTQIDRIKFKGNLSGSTIRSGGSIDRIYISRDSIDNLILSGSGGFDYPESAVSHIDSVKIKGLFDGTTVAAGVHFGDDGEFFTDDDWAENEGHIFNISLGKNSLLDPVGDSVFGFTASDSITAFKLNGEYAESPYELGQFRIATI